MSDVKYSKHKVGQPVIFFPGTLCDERIFNTCWQYLDIPMRAFVPLQWAEDLAQMKMLSTDRLAYFDQPVHLVGFSMGGYIAALTALENQPRVASLTLIGSACDALPTSEITQRKQTLKLIQNKQYKGLSSKQIASNFHPSNQSNVQLQDMVKHMANDLGASVLAAQFQATQARKNLIPQLAKCRFPIQFILGDQDNVVSDDAIKGMKQCLPACDYKLVQEAGHMLPIEQPDRLAKLLFQFLTAR